MYESSLKPRTPASWLSLICLVLAILLWPRLLEQVISLDWKVFNMHKVVFCIQLFMVVMAALFFIGRRQVNNWFSKYTPSGKKIIFAVIALGISTLLCLAAMEIGLRLFRDPLRITWDPVDHKRCRYDSVLGWRYIPNQSVMQKFVKGQPPVPVHTNEQGIRVRATDTQLDPNRPTVIFVGGSYTMGFGLSFEDTFIGQLAAYPNFPYQVVNLGIEAYGTDQAWLRLQKYMYDFNTVAVVYTMIPAHVNRNMNYDRRLLFPGIRMEGTKPLFSLKRNGLVYLKRPPVRLENYSCLRLWALVQRFWLRYGPQPRLELSGALINEMGEEVEAAGAAFIVVYWSFWEEDGAFVYPIFNDFKFPLIDFCAKHPVGWSEMRLPNDSHPNVEAGSFVAKALAEKFVGLGLMPAN